MKVKKLSIVLGIITIISIAQLGLLGTGLKMMVLGTSKAEQPTGAISHQLGVPNRIRIDKVQVDLPVVAQPLNNGTWAVEDGVANYAQGTGVIGSEYGNVGIFAHDRVNGFHTIKDLAMGDQIILYGDNFQAIYQVEAKSVITPQNVDVFAPTTSDELTLVTCDGLFSEKRYMVKAKLAEVLTNGEVD
ncbi:MAG: sortase [Patescibacteria group bacterium]|nr:sortase [Patescibacteria group bacterium]